MAFRIRLIASVLGIVFAAVFPLSQAAALGTGKVTLNTERGTHRFAVEVTETPAEHAKGLMFRRDMAAEHGMIFLYEEPQPVTMWMKNTYLSLDMIFIGSDWRVNRVAAHTEPFSLQAIPSNGAVIGVLEVAAGTADRIGLKVGDEVVFEPGEPRR